jgi:uncharacterized protein YcfL
MQSGIDDLDMIYRFYWIEKIGVNYHRPYHIYQSILIKSLQSWHQMLTLAVSILI